MKKQLFWLTILIITTIGCDQSEITDQIIDNIGQLDPNVEISKNLKIRVSDSAVLFQEITAPEKHTHLDLNNPKDIYPKGIEVKVHDKQGNIIGYLKADYLEENRKTNSRIVRGNVELQLSKNRYLLTHELYWDGEGSIRSPKFIKLIDTGLGDTIYGRGFTANQDFTKIQILQFIAKKKLNKSKIGHL